MAITNAYLLKGSLYFKMDYQDILRPLQNYSLHFRVLKATIYYFKSIFLSCIDAVSIFGNLVFPIFFSCFLFRKHFCFVQLSLTLFFYLSISRFWQLYWEICISYKLLLPSDVVYVF